MYIVISVNEIDNKEWRWLVTDDLVQKYLGTKQLDHDLVTKWLGCKMTWVLHAGGYYINDKGTKLRCYKTTWVLK